MLANPDLLIWIFECLGFHDADYLSFQYAIEIHSRQRQHKNDPLRRMALVCKAWQFSAIVLLYKDLQVRRQKSIPLLLRTLKKSRTLRNMVQSLLVIPPESVMLKWVNKPMQRLHDQVYELCAILPNTVPLHLKLVEQASIPLLKTNCNNIRSLHMVPTGSVFSSQSMISLSLPVLEALTLEFGEHNTSGGDLQFQFQLDAPKLARLRLLSSYDALKLGHGALWLQCLLRKIKHLELRNVRTSVGDDSLYTLLKQCARNLESIVIKPSDIVSDGTLDLAEFRSLKHVTLRTSPFRADRSSSVVLPPGLVSLAIWQMRPKFPLRGWNDQAWWEMASSHSLNWTSRCLESAGASRTPLFKAVTLFVMEDAWKPTNHYCMVIETMCRDLGVEVFAELWKLTPSPA